jgi:hypothetical protein
MLNSAGGFVTKKRIGLANNVYRRANLDMLLDMRKWERLRNWKHYAIVTKYFKFNDLNARFCSLASFRSLVPSF